MTLTIEFLPDRLNREPVVFRGMTTTELFIALIFGLMTGLLCGIIPAVVLGVWALIPTGALAGAALAVIAGGKYLARLKRGRPDTWLYQAMEAGLARRGFGNPRLVQQSAVWCIRRSVKA
ncbi:TIGR03750 family conjugal transfer protein [Salmonella enterica subsp. diarizonae serovar 42:l,v:1,5,7]|uniref:TIGR03750 family conjugal transfer protein n=2 Tax=Enterobacteriaceae TaxID=543 RepID=A0AAN5LAN4_KLEOX|nr:TIGR03750 family conjugal transfer protein [Salmonella enterica]EBE3721551.1 TIGR03750 family conjugal transfer protein [Salmonella enterica subsp. diarizonae serovar 42:l,v:1,5,7]EBX5401714.1 TIGR03750 family conjugal transfer protein [Salmonella enterica subsp. enterica serovar Java]ECC3917165.1 TIGR03750 family conjugal transfer protein [Salmonella enterica subsp. diarizonae]ECU9386592.1 TIGR03750 family conjugal transfer protein [Salmonella enterica subsp. enterica serovar Newport]HAT16